MLTSPSRRSAVAILVASALVLGSGIANAADADGKFSIRGAGSQSCAAYVASIAKPEEFARNGFWLLGYVTARNRLEPATYDILPTEQGNDFPNVVEVICRNSPAIALETAANSAIAVMAPLRQANASAVVQVEADGKTVAIRQDALKLLQSALIAKNLYKGDANGASSPQLVAAIKGFQRKEAIAVTGLPDIDTFIRAVIKR